MAAPHQSAARREKPPTSPPTRRIRRRYHFGPGGLLYVLVTMLIALGALNSGNNLLYWTFGLALSLMLVSGVLSGAMLMGLRVEREWISGATAGGVLRVRYRVRNTNRLMPAFALTIEEEGFDDAPPPKGTRWARFLGRPVPPGPLGPLACPRTFVAHVGPQEVVHAEATGKARRRGAVTFSAIRLHTAFPFGLLRKSLLIPQHGAAVITPEPESLGDGVLRAAIGGADEGAPSRRPGHGDEFFTLREYVHGDSPRDVAWRASAKRGSLLVRQFAAPSPERMWIVLNLRTRGGSDADDERAIRIAAGLARAAEQRGVEYGLSAPLTRLLLQPRHGNGHLGRLMTDLGVLDLGADDGRGARGTLPAHAARAGTSCVVVHSGAIDAGYAPAADNVVQISTQDIGRVVASGDLRPRTAQHAGAGRGVPAP